MPKAIIVPAGTRFGKLTVMLEVEGPLRANGRKQRYFQCVCECQNVIEVGLAGLRCGERNSCGCRRPKHFDRQSAEYTSWAGAISRCHTDTNPRWDHYGGKGIRVCEEWRASYAAFLSYMGRRPTSKHSLDRYPNKNGNYEPGNCRWATNSQQCRNKHKNIWIIHEGKLTLLIDACEQLDFNRRKATWRHTAGWPDENLFT